MDVSYQYLRMFFEPDDAKLRKIHDDDYRSGKMLTGELKSILIEKINAFLEVHQARREDARDALGEFLLEDDGNDRWGSGGTDSSGGGNR